MVHFLSNALKKFYSHLPAGFQGWGFFVTQNLNLYPAWVSLQVFTQKERKIHFTIFNSKALLFVTDYQ